jgi:hypothetical protein
MFNVGIVPIDDFRHDIGRALVQLPADEARKLKRKFRKLWRREARKATERNVAPVTCGLGKRVPTRSERLARKKLIYRALWVNVVVPILDKLKFGNNITESE